MGNMGAARSSSQHQDRASSEDYLGSFCKAQGFAGEPVWLQHLFHGMDHHVKAVDDNARSMMRMMKRSIHCCGPGIRHPRRRHHGSRRECRMQNSTLRFASISSSFKQDQPHQQVKLEELKDSTKQLGEDLRVPVPEEANVPGIGDVKSLALKQLLCGIIAGAVASFAVSPFQILRTRVIAGRGGSSAAEVLSTVAQFEGMQSLMKGNLKITMIVTSVQKGVQFAVYEAVKRKEQEKLGKDPKWLPGAPRRVPVSTVAGAVAGLASTLVVYPFNTLMDRMLLQPSEYSSLWGSASKLIKQNGINELYRGIIPAIATMIPQAAASFYTYETVRNHMHEKHGGSKNPVMTAVASISAGAAAGLVAAALTYPLEVARKQISISALPQGTVGIGGAISYNNLSQVLVGIAQREGLGGFYRGFVVQALQFIPMTAISFTVYEVAKRSLVAQHEERRDEVKG